MKKTLIKFFLFSTLLLVFIVSIGLTVPPVPSEINQAIEMKLSVINRGLPIFIAFNIFYAQFFIIAFGFLSKFKNIVLYFCFIATGIISIRSMAWYLGELDVYGYIFYNLFVISIFYIALSFIIFTILLYINITFFLKNNIGLQKCQK